MKALRPLIDSGVLVEGRSGAGRSLVVRDAVEAQSFFLQRYPASPPFEGASSRVIGVASFRNTKILPSNEPRLVCIRAWRNGVMFRADQSVDAAAATAEHGVFAFLLGDPSPYSLHGTCALVENPAVFTDIERLSLPIGLAVYGHGRASNQLVGWLAQMTAKDFTLLHLPDYDPVGLSEFGRLRERLGERVRLHLPGDLPARFERFSNRSLLGKLNSRALLAKLRRSPIPEIQQVLELMDRHNAGLEQEALLLGLETVTSGTA